MKPIVKLAWRRIKNGGNKNLLFVLTLLFSMLLISFFISFGVRLEGMMSFAYALLPFGKFLHRVRTGTRVTVILLSVFTFLIVRVHCRRRRVELEQILAVLRSVGASNRQKNALIVIDLLMLHLPPVAIGSILGAFLGVGGVNGDFALEALLLGLGSTILGSVLIVIGYFIPHLSFKKSALIQRIKHQNLRASLEIHSYHRSRTFQSQSFIKRLAKKSAEYYRETYSGIAVVFASVIFYPALAILMLFYCGKGTVVLDRNPYDTTDTVGAVWKEVEELFGFMLIGFAVLAILGILQFLLMARLQYLERKQNARTYLILGMEQKTFDKMIFYEMKSVLLRSLIGILFGVLLANLCYALALG